MKYQLRIDQITALEWGINLPLAALFDFCYSVPAWAEPVIIDGVVWYYASRNKALEEVPILSDPDNPKPDTVYRGYRKLDKAGVIQYKKHGKKDLIRITDKGKKWNSEKNPSYWSELGKKSEYDSEKNPTDNNTNIDTTLPPAHEDDEVTPDNWYKDGPERLASALAQIAKYFQDTPRRIGEIQNLALVEMSKSEFKHELRNWAGHNADNYRIMNNPVTALTSGKGSFVAWLSKPWAREKYKPGRVREGEAMTYDKKV